MFGKSDNCKKGATHRPWPSVVFAMIKALGYLGPAMKHRLCAIFEGDIDKPRPAQEPVSIDQRPSRGKPRGLGPGNDMHMHRLGGRDGVGSRMHTGK